MLQGFLRHSSVADVTIGPFVDDTDFKTAETGLTILSTEVDLMKAGGAQTTKSEATALLHRIEGMYQCKLNATDTGTTGELLITVREAGALVVCAKFLVIAAPAYDIWFGGAPSTNVGCSSISANAITAGAIASNAFTNAKFASNAISAAELNADVATEIVATVIALLPTALVGGLMNSNIDAIDGSTDAADKLQRLMEEGIYLGTAEASGSTTTTVEDSSLPAADAANTMVGSVIKWLTGNCKHEQAEVTGYSSTGPTLTFTPAISEAPHSMVFMVG